MNTNRFAVLALSSLILVLTGCSDGSNAPSAAAQSATTTPGEFDRTVLPIPDPVFPKITELDARNATAPPAFSVTAPEGAPNVVIVLIDDIGFGASDGFGGAIGRVFRDFFRRPTRGLHVLQLGRCARTCG